jgi:cell fate regulator YaaT (PSP1 superfamily)
MLFVLIYENMIINKGTLYWSRGCVTEAGEEGEIISCKAVKNCHKLTVYNWLRNIPADREYDIFEVRFKNTRKGFYRNVNNIDLKEGDIVAVEASPGHDIGIISALGPVAEIKFLKSSPNVTDAKSADLRKIYRIARTVDIEKWQEAVSLEYATMIQARQIASSLKLNMKIGDVDFQGDRTKAIFYYIADERVDFRELIKIMAETFKIRIEMRQIGARQEAGLIGGIGPCGRELCCAQWMRNFVSVSTNSVRFQEISVNPLKLAGQCSKLKCCLNYELDTYLDAWDAFPKVRQLETMNGTIYLQKTDVLKGIMYFSIAESPVIFPISVEKVREIIDGNKKGEKPELYIDSGDIISEFKSAVGEDSLTRFDKNRKKRKNRKKNVQSSNKPQETGSDGRPQENVNSVKPQENKNNGKPQRKNGNNNWNNRQKYNRNRKNDNKNQA